MITNVIKNRIREIGTGRLWKTSDFPDYKPMTVAKILSRLAARGFITKIKNGTYFYGKSTPLGITTAQPNEIADKILPDQFIGGLHAYYNLGLTTQIPASIVIVSSHRNNIHKAKIKRRNVTHLKGATKEEFWIFEALRNIKNIPDCSPHVAIKKIKVFIKHKGISLVRLSKYVLHEPPRVRALIGAIGQDLGADEKVLLNIKKKINMLSTFKIDVQDSLKYAKDWNIK